MAAVQARKLITLIGRLESPIVVSNPFFKKSGCWIKIVGDLKSKKKPKLTFVGKLVKGERKPPTVLRGYRGFVKVSCVDSSEGRGRKKIEQFLQSNFLGRYTTEGFGKVQWIDCQIADFKPSFLPKNPDSLPITERYCPTCNRMVKVYYWFTFIQGSYASFYQCTECKHLWRGKKLKIRKGLGSNYPKELRRLILALLLHDFVHTENHPSKIYEQVTIQDEEIREACLKHHAEEANGNKLLPVLKHYDVAASIISRKKPFKVIARYDHLNGKIDFKQLARAIEEWQHSPYRLYQFIYQSTTLQRIVESMDYGKSSLRNHLLLMVNLAINDYRDRRLVITNGKIQINN